METENVGKNEQEVEFFYRDCVDLSSKVNDARMNQENFTILC